MQPPYNNQKINDLNLKLEASIDSQILTIQNICTYRKID
jgi:hypothetical protein